MTAEVSKLTAFMVVNDSAGPMVSKLVAYAIMEPGTESGGTPPSHNSFTYAQLLRRP